MYQAYSKNKSQKHSGVLDNTYKKLNLKREKKYVVCEICCQTKVTYFLKPRYFFLQLKSLIKNLNWKPAPEQ